MDIREYPFTQDVSLAWNSYLAELFALVSQGSSRQAILDRRSSLVKKYSFHIPTQDSLARIARYGPVCDFGAGSGYLSWCLRQKGCDSEAIDIAPPDEEENYWHDDTWVHIYQGDVEVASSCPHRTLLLSWPPLDSPMAMEAVENWLRRGGKWLVYIGAPLSTADYSFHLFRKDNSLKRIHEFSTWSWPGVDEVMEVYRF